MDFESKIISREVSQLLWEMEKTVGTAESCTGGRIAEAIIAVPGASKYFKGDIPIGTIWLACGTQDKQVTMMVQEDHGRDINLAIATNKVMQLFLDFLKTENNTAVEG